MSAADLAIGRLGGECRSAGKHIWSLGACHRIAAIEYVAGDAADAETMHTGILAFDLADPLTAAKKTLDFVSGQACGYRQPA